MHNYTFWDYLTDVTFHDFLIVLAKAIGTTIIIFAFAFGVNMLYGKTDDNDFKDFFDNL